MFRARPRSERNHATSPALGAIAISLEFKHKTPLSRGDRLKKASKTSLSLSGVCSAPGQEAKETVPHLRRSEPLPLVWNSSTNLPSREGTDSRKRVKRVFHWQGCVPCRAKKRKKPCHTSGARSHCH